MEAKWFFIAIIGVAFSVSVMVAFNSYNATKAGLEECPKYGAGSSGDAIWIKSCKEYTELIKKGNK
jgi:hypothetical protein